MNILKVGDNAPDFSCKNQHGNTVNLSDMIGKKVVLFFYPKANTPGCTAEACNLNDNYNRFKSEGYEIIGSPRDELKLSGGPSWVFGNSIVFKVTDNISVSLDVDYVMARFTELEDPAFDSALSDINDVLNEMDLDL